MTDAVIDGGASAPAEPVAVIDPADADRAPTALGAQVPEQKPETKSINDALDNALAKQEAKVAEAAKQPVKEPAKLEPKVAEKPKAEPVKEAPVRGEHGHFAAKEPAKVEAPAAETVTPPVEKKPYHEPPSRFIEQAKTDWATTPDSVKEETYRAFSNLERGLQEHQQFREQLKPYEQLAQKNNTTIPQAMDRYIAMEVAVRKNPVHGFQLIAQDMGLDVKKVAAAILGQPAPTPDQSQQTIARLERTIEDLKKQVGGVTSSIQQQQARAVHTDVEAFAAQHEDFDTLAPFIAGIIQSKPGISLEDAHAEAKAEMQNIAAKLGFTTRSAAPAAPVTPAATAEPVNPAGQKSVSGSPANGATPPRKKGKLPSIDETLSRVMRQ